MYISTHVTIISKEQMQRFSRAFGGLRVSDPSRISFSFEKGAVQDRQARARKRPKTNQDRPQRT